MLRLFLGALAFMGTRAQTMGYDWNGFSASGLGCGSDSGVLNVGLGQSLPPGATGLKVKQIAFAIYGTNSLPPYIQLHGSTATPRLLTSSAVQCCGTGCDLAVQVTAAGYSWYESPCGRPACANANKWYYMDFSGTAVGTTEQTGISEATFYNAGGSQIGANMINLGSGSVFFMSYTVIIPSPTPTPSLTKSPVSPSLTASETASTSISRSVTASGSTDPTDSRSVSASRSESRTTSVDATSSRTPSTTMSVSRAPSSTITSSRAASLSVTQSRTESPVSPSVSPTVTPYLPWFQGLVGCCHNSIDTSVQSLNILTPTPPYPNMAINRLAVQFWPLSAGSVTFSVALMNVASGSQPGGFILASTSFTITSPGSFPTFPQQVAVFNNLGPISSYVLGEDVEYALAFYAATPGIVDLVLGVPSLSPYFWNGLMTEPTGSFYSVGETNPPEVTFWYQSANIAFVAVGAGQAITSSPSTSLTATTSLSSSISATTSSSSSGSPTTAVTQSTSVTGSSSYSISGTSSLTTSSSDTPSSSLSVSISSSNSMTISSIATVSGSGSLTLSQSQSLSLSATLASTPSISAIASASPSITTSMTTSLTRSLGVSSSETGSSSRSTSRSASSSESISLSPTSSATLSSSIFPTETQSQTSSLSTSESTTVTRSQSVTSSVTPSLSISITTSKSSDNSGSPSVSFTMSMSITSSTSITLTPSPQSFQQVSNTTMSATSTPQFYITAFPTVTPTYSPTQNATLPIVVVDVQGTNMTTTNALLGSTLALIIVAVALAAGRYLPAGWTQRFRRMIPQSTIDSFKRDPLGSVTAMVNDPKSVLKSIKIPDSVKSIADMVPKDLKDKFVPESVQNLITSSTATVPHVEADTGDDKIERPSTPEHTKPSRRAPSPLPVDEVQYVPAPIQTAEPEKNVDKIIGITEDSGVNVEASKEILIRQPSTILQINPEDLDAVKALLEEKGLTHNVLG